MTGLYDLLPAVHRVRDADQGSPLRDLLEVVDCEFGLLRGDIEQLYDDWFIETCEDWVVPYIGDLLGVTGLGGARSGRRSQRALVANSLRYRRRKGTVGVLEQLASDVTGWTAKAVEFFELLGWDQHLDHVRPDRGGTADLRDAGRAEAFADTAFDTYAHTADVRHIDTGRGRHNIPNVGLFLWRLQAYPLDRSTPFGPGERFTFDPLGRDVPLFNRPAAEQAIEHLAEERNVEGPLRRRPLHDELARKVPAAVAEDDGVDRYLDPGDPVFAVWLGNRFLRPDELSICDLGDPGRRAVAPAVAVDPVRGRLALRAGDARRPEVSWAAGFSGDLGGGPYDRRASVRGALTAAREATGDAPWWQRGVVRGAVGPELVGDLASAVSAFGARPAKPLALISVMDNQTYIERIEIVVPGGSRLVIAAGDWQARPDPLGGPPRRRLGDIAATRTRPTIAADITIRGTPGPAGSPPGVVVLDGFLIDGTVTVEPGALGGLRIAHSTIVPRPGTRLSIQAGGADSTRNVRLEVDLDHAICGEIEASEYIARTTILDSIVQGVVRVPDLVIERSTVLGQVGTRTIHASESIFTERLQVARRQTGCVRFSWLPLDSQAPRRFRCQPTDHAATGVRPTFTSTTHGDPGYGQLARATPREILQGAEDEGEMGAFNFLAQPRRLADFEARLDEYMRLGLEAGVFFVT